MIPDFEWCFAGKEQVRWCIRRRDDELTLCGKPVGYCPTALQPATTPAQVCPGCHDVMFVDRSRPTPGVGVCPHCGGDVPVSAGRVGVHMQWLVGGDGPYQSDTPCVGVNLAPKRRTR